MEHPATPFFVLTHLATWLPQICFAKAKTKSSAGPQEESVLIHKITAQAGMMLVLMQPMGAQGAWKYCRQNRIGCRDNNHQDNTVS